MSDVEPPLFLVWEEARAHPRKRAAGPGDDGARVGLLRGAAAAKLRAQPSMKLQPRDRNWLSEDFTVYYVWLMLRHYLFYILDKLSVCLSSLY